MVSIDTIRTQNPIKLTLTFLEGNGGSSVTLRFTLCLSAVGEAEVGESEIGAAAGFIMPAIGWLATARGAGGARAGRESNVEIIKKYAVLLGSAY